MFLVSGAAVHLAGFSHGLVPFVSVGARPVGQRTCGRGHWLASVLELPACTRLDLFVFVERVTTVDMDQHVPVGFSSGVCGGACRGQSRVHQPSGSGPRSGTAPFCNLWWGMSGTAVCDCWSRTIVEPCETSANPTEQCSPAWCSPATPTRSPTPGHTFTWHNCITGATTTSASLLALARASR